MIKTKCRICLSSDLEPILDLGHQPPSDAFLTKDQLQQPETSYPLALNHCPKCDQLQLSYVVSPNILYRSGSGYPYRTGDNKQGVKHFKNLAEEIASQYLHPDELVVDIGGNDGTLIREISKQPQIHGKYRILNIDPSDIGPSFHTIATFFNYGIAKDAINKYGNAKVIIATNVLAHVDEIYDFLQGVHTLLADNGIFIVEVPNAISMINKCAYDTIYHEHLSYFTPHAFSELMKRNEFHIVKTLDLPLIHGGSIRYYMKKGDDYNNVPTSNTIPLSSLQEFARIVKSQANELYDLCCNLYQKDKIITGFSAPAKGNTLINYSNIGKFMCFITEVSESPKINMYTPGSHIPVISDDVLNHQSAFNIDVAIIFAWNWADQIIKNICSTGFKGDYLIPIPKPHFVDDNLKPFEGHYYGHK